MPEGTEGGGPISDREPIHTTSPLGVPARESAGTGASDPAPAPTRHARTGTDTAEVVLGPGGDAVVVPREPPEFTSFHRAHHPAITRALALTVCDRELGIEATDEAMTRACQRWHVVGTYDDPATWVHRVGLDWARSWRRRRRWSTSSPFADDGVDSPDPDLARAIAGLDHRHRAVVVLHNLLDWPVDSMAEALGVAPGTVETRLHRARVTLAAGITGGFPPHDGGHSGHAPSLDARIRAEVERRAGQVPLPFRDPDHVVATARHRTGRARFAAVAVVAVSAAGGGVVAWTLADRADPPSAAVADVGPGVGGSGTDDAGSAAGDDVRPTADGGAGNGRDEPASSSTDDAGTADTTTPDPPHTDPVAPATPTADPAHATAGFHAPAVRSAIRSLGVDTSGTLELEVLGDRVVVRTGPTALAAGRLGRPLRAVASPARGDSDRIVELEAEGDTMYALGVGIDGWWLRRSGNLRDWTPMRLPTGGLGIDRLVEHLLDDVDLAVGPDGPVLSGTVVHRLRIAEILPDEIVESGSYSIGDVTGDRSVIIVYDERSGEVAEEIELADLGIDPATIDHLVRSETSPYLAVPDPDRALVDAGGTVPSGAVLSAVTATRLGLFARGFDAALADTVVWRADGGTWRPLPVSAASTDPRAPTLLEVGRRVIAFSAQGPLLALHWSANGDRWSEVRLDDLLGRAPREFAIRFVAASDTTIAAVVDTAGPRRVASWVLSSRNGTRWSATRMDRAVPGLRGGAVDGLAVAGDQVLIASAGEVMIIR